MSILDESERANLKAQHRIERDGRIRDRIKGVLLHDKGWSWVEIADTLLISEGAARHHIAEYRSSKKRLWKWMKETTVYNTYYKEFDEFRQAILGFFSALSDLDPGSELAQQLRSRISDNFRSVYTP